MDSAQQCPLLTAGSLCKIQTEHGEGLLPHTCATYPRIVYRVAERTETALSLSCPEAARMVLLTPRLLTGAGKPQDRTTDDDRDDSLLPSFTAVRDFAVGLVKNRSYPLWQRLFLLGIFSQRFDAISPGEHRQRTPRLLLDFKAMVAAGAWQSAMNTVPADHARQLDLVLRAAGMLHQAPVRPRFAECIRAFTQGIGNGPGATLPSLTTQYAFAHDRYFAPFFREHPHILENYLINAIFRRQFPFGREWALKPSAPSMEPAPSMEKEFVLLAMQFALVKGLLIGVAGMHREKFSARHVVHTVQSASKHFEHHTEFLTRSHALLVDCGMDSAWGASVLLRNAESNTIQPRIPSPRSPASPKPARSPSHQPQRM